MFSEENNEFIGERKVKWPPRDLILIKIEGRLRVAEAGYKTGQEEERKSISRFEKPRVDEGSEFRITPEKGNKLPALMLY
jgi:hypothetical protein